MGKSANAMVLAMREPVVPKTGTDGIKQPMYNRSKTVMRMSSRVIALNNCIATKLKGKKAGSRVVAKENFKSAAESCKRGA